MDGTRPIGTCIGGRRHRAEITAKKSGVTASDVLAKLATMKLSQRRFAKSAGVGERSVRAALARPGDVPNWMVIALQNRELVEGLGKIVASYAQPGTHVTQTAVKRLFAGMFPPVPIKVKKKVKDLRRRPWVPRKQRPKYLAAKAALAAARPLPALAHVVAAPKSDFDFEDTVNGIKTVSFAIKLR
jgi:hypothetical protein